ncbi:MAG: hypothetical protein OER83_00915 [Flavobacteriaceae bacterium]|nr:hypothetical protein [Flavobacteriaceae bacterium]
MRSYCLIFGVLLGLTSYAQTCCSGGVPLSNNLGMANEGAGTWQIGLNYDYNNLNSLFASSEKLDDNSRRRITHSILWNTSYSLTNHWAFEVLFSWVNQIREISQFSNLNVTETKGIGDAVLMATHTWPSLLGEATNLVLGFGAKAPLGKSDLSSDEGFQLTADLQPGSGAWDGIGYMSLFGQGFRPTATWTGSVLYRLTGKNTSYLNNTSTYEFGNVLQGLVGYTEELLIGSVLFNPGVVVKYRHAKQDQINDFDFPNTGGEWIFLRPELTFSISPATQLKSQWELPLYSNVDGTQLTPTSRLTFSLLFQIRSNKNINIEP